MGLAISEGREPETWVDDRPLAKPRMDAETRLARQQAGLRGPPKPATPREPAPDPDDFDVEFMLGGLRAEELDAESNAEFEALRRLAFAHARQVMEMPLDPNHKHFAKVLQIKTTITQAVFTATTRVRPGDLREKDDDGVGALLDEVRKESGEAQQYEPDPDDRAGEDFEEPSPSARARAELFS